MRTEHHRPDDHQLPTDEPHGDEPDGELVLAWWQHPVNIMTLLIATALSAAMIGVLISDALSTPGHSEVDIGFLQDMREHHDQGIAMGSLFLELDDTSAALRTVARSVVVGQSIEIGRMVQLLRGFGAAEINESDTSMTWMGMSAAAGSMPGMASRQQIDRLAASSGTEADRLFIALMTAHHLGALDMAEYAARNAEDPEVRALASSITNSQSGEIVEMLGLMPGQGAD